MWLSTVRTEDVSRSAIARFDNPSPIIITISRFAVGQRQGLERPGEAPECWRRRIVRPAHRRAPSNLNADPRRSWLRYARAAWAAASTAATRSPIRSNSSDTEDNSAASPSCRATANRAATPTRGPSTIASSSRNLRCARTVTELGGGLQTDHFRRELPFGCSPFGRRQQTAIASLTAPWPATTHARARLQLVVQRPKRTPQLVQRGKRGGCLVS